MRSPHVRARPRLIKGSIPTLLVALTSIVRPAVANPFPKDALHDFLNLGFLKDRSCATYCGAENEHCCTENQVCTTNADYVAGCATPVTLVVRSDGDYTVYTTTWTETETFTSTISSYWAASTASGGTCTPPSGSGEIACGSICCASWQYCAYEGQCVSNPGSTATTTAAGAGTTSYSTYATTITTSGSTITTQFSAPYRVTGTGSTSTGTGTLESATATNNVNGTLATTGGSQLSGGAIAGIVIGVIAGVVILLAICACCIMRGLWNGLLALLGLGGKKKSRSRERETIIVEEERYSRHGSRRAASASNRDRHSGWFAGDRPPRSSAAESRRPSEKKRESNATSWAGAGALSTILVMLGLRRDKKRRESAAAQRSTRARSTVSSSYFSDSYTASSPSEFSSDYTYSSVYTPTQSQHPRGPRTESVVHDRHSVRSASVGAGRYRDDPYPPKSNLPPEYADSASDGDRTRDSRRTRRTSTTRVSRAPSRR